MTGGIVQGGWEFVWAAYGLSVLVLGGYATSVILRLRSADRAAAKKEAKR
jgi:heme exporter protein CcmD